MDRERAVEDCSVLLRLVGGMQGRWQSSPDPRVRDLASRLDEVARVLERLDWLLRQDRDPVAGR